MNDFLRNNNPVLFALNNPSLHKSETLTIVGGRLDMGGLPDSLLGVTVTDKNNNVFVEVTEERVLDELEFRVNYMHGWMYFNPEFYPDGTVVTIDFYSRGIELTPSSRIYHAGKYGESLDITDTLDKYLDDVIRETSFTPASTRENIKSGESLPTILGKISKWFADLKSLAFKSSVSTSDINNESVTKAKLSEDISSDIDNAVKYVGLFPSGESLDDYNSNNQSGIWTIRSGGFEPIDLPIPRIANEEVLFIISKSKVVSTPHTYQKLLYLSQNRELTRYYNGNMWSEWYETAQTRLDRVNPDGNFISMGTGSGHQYKYVLYNTPYNQNSFLKTDSVNANGDFINGTVRNINTYNPLKINDGINFDFRYTMDYLNCAVLDETGNLKDTWESVDDPSIFIKIPSGCVLDFAKGIITSTEKFELVRYDDPESIIYNDNTKFNIMINIELCNNTSLHKNLISFLNGSITVQKYGYNGIRLVIKKGVNGNSLETSSFIQIPSNGLTTIILSGNINNYVKLSVKNNNNTLSEELSLSEPVYIPNEQGISFEFDSGCQLKNIFIDVGKTIQSTESILMNYMAYEQQTIATTGMLRDLGESIKFRAKAEDLGDLSTLDTKDRSSMVNAVNELLGIINNLQERVTYLETYVNDMVAVIDDDAQNINNNNNTAVKRKEGL